MPLRSSPRFALLCFTALTLLATGAFALALVVGPLRLSLSEFMVWIGGGEAGTAGAVLSGLRLPRAVATFVCGALLALAGALMQVLLRNPLADPYVLGVSGGASLAGLAAITLGWPWAGVQASAFAGALTAMLLVFGLARGDGSWTQARLLLTGVVVASACGAGVALLLALAQASQLQGMLFWVMGDAGNARASVWALLLPAGALVLLWPFARDFNLLARGAQSAAALGVRVQALRLLLFAVASLLTAVAVSLVGAVGFIGLVVPHLLRLALGNDQRLLLPATALGGGSLLLLADTVARSVLAPVQLPVGALTALLGAPLFLWLLARHSR